MVPNIFSLKSVRNISYSRFSLKTWTAAQKMAFCPGGKVSSIECVTSDGIASYSTGEMMECSVERGLVCLNADNDPIPCSDYKIRYFCECASMYITLF